MEQPASHESLEAEIHELAREAAHELPGAGISREAIRSTIERKLYAPVEESAGGSEVRGEESPGAAPVSNDSLPAYAATLPIEAKLKAEQLLDLAWHKGIGRAIREVKRGDPLTMDLFHDAIVERLYEAFKARGIVK